MKSLLSLSALPTLLFAAALGAAALAVGAGSDRLAMSQSTVAQQLVMQSQRFDALATAGRPSSTGAARAPSDTGGASGAVLPAPRRPTI